VITQAELAAYREHEAIIRAHMAEAELVAREIQALRQPEISFSTPESPRERVQEVTVRPVAGEPLSVRPGWLQRNWPQLTIGLVLVSGLGIGAWLLVLAIAAAIATLVAVLAAALPLILGIGGLLLILILCAGGKAAASCTGLHCGGCKR